VVSAKAEDLGKPFNWVVTFRLNDAGTTKMNRLARASYNRQPPENSVAIVVDGVVQSAPAFREPSFIGDIQISGNFTEAQAKALANTVSSLAARSRDR
jgi:preprotein translocase subunit SecD